MRIVIGGMGFKMAGMLLRVTGSGVARLGYLTAWCGPFAAFRWSRPARLTLLEETALVVFLPIAGLLIFRLGRRTDLRGRRMIAPAAKAGWVPAEGAFVLYLRSFRNDEALRVMDTHFTDGQPSSWLGARGVLQSGLTQEEQLVAALRKSGMGPVVAVGRPSERLPDVGAIRVYRPDGEWKEAVLGLMRRARFVFIALGPGDGLEWELDQALRNVPPGRLALLAHAMLMSDEEQARLRALLEDRLARAGLPSLYRKGSWIITFDDDGRPRRSSLKLGSGDVGAPSGKEFYKSLGGVLRPIAGHLAQEDGLRGKSAAIELAERALAAAGELFAYAGLPLLFILLSWPYSILLIAGCLLGEAARVVVLSLRHGALIRAASSARATS